MKRFGFTDVMYVQGITDVDLTSLNFINRWYLGVESVNLQPSEDSGNVTSTDT
jgi:hypothetical protein